MRYSSGGSPSILRVPVDSAMEKQAISRSIVRASRAGPEGVPRGNPPVQGASPTRIGSEKLHQGPSGVRSSSRPSSAAFSGSGEGTAGKFPLLSRVAKYGRCLGPVISTRSSRVMSPSSTRNCRPLRMVPPKTNPCGISAFEKHRGHSSPRGIGPRLKRA